MRVSAVKTIHISDLDVARESIVSTLNQLGATLKVVEEDYVEAKLGSQAKLRTKGGMMASIEDYPLIVMAKFSSGGELEITVGENLGFGLLTGIKGKFQEACDFAINELLMNAQGQSSKQQEEAPATKTCPFCAEEVKALAIKCKHCGSEI